MRLFYFFTFAFAALNLSAQTITYTNFSKVLTDTTDLNIGNNASFNNSIKTITGSGVTWDASALTVASGTPTVHMMFKPTSSTPQGAQYPNSNYAAIDPALTSILEYSYKQYVADSLVEWGSYAPSASHEIYQNPDKRLIFPLSYGQTFTDTYAKTNYSDATTVSSYQTGTRTVTFAGFGTLILPQGSSSNVAYITEVRTNSLGPDSYNFTWYDINTGKVLLLRGENNGNITTVYSAESISTSVKEDPDVKVHVFPNPVHEGSEMTIVASGNIGNAKISLFDAVGKEVKSATVENGKVVMKCHDLAKGIYFYNLERMNEVIKFGKIVVQ